MGRTALQAAFTSPEAFEPSPKRRLADREVFLAGSMIAATEMVAAVFAEVLARASQVMAAAPDVVIVTHPDQWSAPLQQLLAQSACAGEVDRNRLRLVSEAQGYHPALIKATINDAAQRACLRCRRERLAAFSAAEREAWTVLERSYQLLFAGR